MNIYLGFILESISSNASDESVIVLAKNSAIFLLVILLGLTVIFLSQQFPFFLVHAHFPLKKLSEREKFILQSEVDYYKRLPEKKKKYFEHRVVIFLLKHPIVPRENIVVTPQMRVLIASASVALTFGFKRYTYTSFRSILVYPDIYFSTITEQYHKGEFNPKSQVLVFSWKHFLEGNSITNDNINLGLHEFAHALHFEMKMEQHPNSHYFKKYFLKLLLEIRKAEKREKLLNTTYFRQYAFENKYEFLAVLIENYFETPDVFQKEFPVFYQKIRKMLNQ
jgi:Mlc titration factor MtfA (ptsG expression regulator)